MTDDGLTPSESAILIVLMSEAREISNTELVARFGLDVRKTNRDKLNRLRYVASRKEGRTYVHALDDKGWVRVQHDLHFDSPRARALGAALFALHTNLRDRVLPRTGYRSFTEMFSHAADLPTAADEPVAEKKDNLEERIRDAYASLADEPGSWVSLARLRPLFGDVDRSDLDQALQRLGRSPDVNIVPESNQKALGTEEINAAVRIGGQDKHLLAIGV